MVVRPVDVESDDSLSDVLTGKLPPDPTSGDCSKEEIPVDEEGIHADEEGNGIEENPIPFTETGLFSPIPSRYRYYTIGKSIGVCVITDGWITELTCDYLVKVKNDRYLTKKGFLRPTESRLSGEEITEEWYRVHAGSTFKIPTGSYAPVVRQREEVSPSTQSETHSTHNELLPTELKIYLTQFKNGAPLTEEQIKSLDSGQKLSFFSPLRSRVPVDETTTALSDVFANGNSCIFTNEKRSDFWLGRRDSLPIGEDPDSGRFEFGTVRFESGTSFDYRPYVWRRPIVGRILGSTSLPKPPLTRILLPKPPGSNDTTGV